MRNFLFYFLLTKTHIYLRKVKHKQTSL